MPSAQLPGAVFAMDPVHLPLLFPAPLLARLRRTAEIDPALVVRDFTSPAAASALAGADVLITGWGCPHLSTEALAAAPRLRTVLHAAGSVRSLVGEPLWSRGVTVSSAVTGNALPVAEYTLAMILLAGKDAFTHRERFRRTRVHPAPEETAATGNLGRRVGVIGASRVGRRLLELLRPYDFEVLLHDPYVDAAEAAELGARLLSLEDLLRHSDIVSLHAPDIPETPARRTSWARGRPAASRSSSSTTMRPSRSSSLPREPRDVRGEEDVREPVEGRVGGQRLGLGDVEDRVQPAGDQLVGEGGVVDQGAPRGVDQDAAVADQGEPGPVEHVLSSRHAEAHLG
ncbi:NAD(P)-dependent oxidoreductase [Streptomyces canus]|uniref:NAD(P)-dependent oxidoreductase n=1 Tax=Streptomyces canus TaxID=58343 RepID=UPI003CEFE9F4